MPNTEDFGETQIDGQIKSMASRPEELRDYLDKIIPFLKGPVVKDFSPRRAYAGATIEIKGKNFAAERYDNKVEVGGKPAIVVTSSRDRLKVITDLRASSGPVVVDVGGKTSRAPFDFVARERPDQASEADGPPIQFSGCSLAVEPGHIPPLGVMKVLFVLTEPGDCAPKDAEEARMSILKAKEAIHKYYHQASYGRLDVSIDVTSNWHSLTGTVNDYADLPGEDIRCTALDRLMAESAEAAAKEGFDLNNYAALACVINLSGRFVRARGGWSCQNFSYYGKGKHINITADHQINLIAISESANWGRFAHEIGHGIVSRPSRLSGPAQAMILSEDVYSSDLVDKIVATAQDFDLMGRHDIHPLFSGYYMDRLGWYRPENVLELGWGRGAFSKEYELAAHGLSENEKKGRYHLLRIKVTEGLFYYVEARQRPGRTGQIFDEGLPLGGAHVPGGVVVSRVLAGTINMNQQTRFITLLHPPRALLSGEEAGDPARSLKITVVDDAVETNPLVCRVRVEWARPDDDDPDGTFDLRIEPEDERQQSPDIWIDRIPYGVYDQPPDDQGRPKGNGDKPRPLEINHIWARVHCDGNTDVSDVRVTFYAVEPPGIGDNGNWGPLETKVLPRISADTHVDTYINWVPAVGRHTCIKVWIEPKAGEISAQNNHAHENVLRFESPASSPHEPVVMPVAVRNPLLRHTVALIKIARVPQGYTVHFPHAWLWLEPHQERRLEAIVVPDETIGLNGDLPAARIQLNGYLPWDYAWTSGGSAPPSRMVPMGEIIMSVSPKRRTMVWVQEDTPRSSQSVVAFSGSIDPPMEGETLRIELIDPEDRLRVISTTTDSQGRFSVAFDLLIEPSLYHNEEQKPCVLIHGVYKAQAKVIDSGRAAECESDVVCVSR